MTGRAKRAFHAPRIFMVAVDGHEPVPFSARTRSAAMYEAFLSYSNIYDISFGAFLKRARAALCATTLAIDGYDYVRRAYGVDPTLGQRVRLKNEEPGSDGREGFITYPGASTAHVHVMLDGQRRAVTVHPSNVDLLPILDDRDVRGVT